MTLSRNRSLRYSEAGRELMKAVWPLQLDYESPCCTLFLSGLQNPLRLNMQRRWIVRDGLIPLVRFFLQHPIPPKGLRTKLFVDSDFRRFIPRSWAPFFGTRNLVVTSHRKKRPFLLLTGILGEEYVSPGDLSSRVLAIKSLLQKQCVNPERVFTFLPQLNFRHHHLIHSSYIFDCALEIVSQLGPCKPLRWDMILKQDDFKEFYWADVGGKWVVSDPSYAHRILGRGGIPLDAMKKQGQRIIETLMISENHGWNLCSIEATKASREKELFALDRFVNQLRGCSQFGGRLPGSDWLVDWVKGEEIQR